MILNLPVDDGRWSKLVKHMLDITFTALADPTRRGMLAALALGEKPISDAAGGKPSSSMSAHSCASSRRRGR